MSYTETDAYQREIAEQYKKRNLELPLSEVSSILSAVGVEVVEAEIREADAGNMNATFIAGQYVVKVSNESDKLKYVANQIVSEQLPDEKVVRVVTHDVREKTEYEVLVMERAPGSMWLPVMPNMTEEENKKLFAQVLKVATASRKIAVTDKFGSINGIVSNQNENGFFTHRALLEARLTDYVRKIELQEYLDQAAIKKIVKYVTERLQLFDEDTPSFVHTDLHMSNVMQQDGELTAVIDWDSTESAPSYRGLIPLIGLIDNPAQFVEGTPEYGAYKGKKFEYLYPLLKEAFLDELADPKLAEKLNILFIIDGLMWVADDWSKEWNKEMVAKLSTKEVVLDGDMKNTYSGLILEKIRQA